MIIDPPKPTTTLLPPSKNSLIIEPEETQKSDESSGEFPAYVSKPFTNDTTPYESSISSHSSSVGAQTSPQQFAPKGASFHFGSSSDTHSPTAPSISASTDSGNGYLSESESSLHSTSASQHSDTPYIPTGAPAIPIPAAVDSAQRFSSDVAGSATSPVANGQKESASSRRSTTMPHSADNQGSLNKPQRSHSSMNLFRRHRGDSTGSTTSITHQSSHSSVGSNTGRTPHGSMADLKRFFQKPWKNHTSHLYDYPPTASNGGKNSGSPSSSPNSPTLRGVSKRSPTNLNETKRSLSKHYGKLGKALGEGAGGNVRLVTNSKDNRIFAVKEFRQRQNYESARDYSKKVTAEYCIGLTLKHPNIVETVDIIYDSDNVYQVMEYCEYDLFAIVMSGKMSRPEIYCDFKQFMNGIKYMLDSGLAHRDLKLDNCVINAQGIVKIIDFGSAAVFRYPETEKIHEAVGIVGSDPYLAPEVVTRLVYDPRPADIWSAAIVFCCMLMRKFPWKAPRQSDNSFKLFAGYEDGSPKKTNQGDSTSGANAGSAKLGLPSTTGTHGVMTGPQRLLKSLPVEVHPLMLGMLTLEPEKRFTIDDCWNDSWLSSIKFCTLDDNRTLIPAAGHAHTNVCFEDAHIATLEKQNKKKTNKDKLW